MVEVKKYHLPPTALIPNSPHPLLHYPGLLDLKADRDPEKVYDLFKSNGWQTRWIFRYGPTQESHYHSRAHECMAVLTGSATIRFGVADTDPDLEKSTHGSAKEDGGVEIQANAGDVFVLPAGTAHKTHDTTPGEFALLTPGDGNHAPSDEIRSSLSVIKRTGQLSGFTMLGAYPVNGATWDFAVGGDSEGDYEQVWAVPKPEKDPVLGTAEEGVCGQWT